MASLTETGQFLDEQGADWQPGSSTFQYPNDQAATTIWYHDHILGMTRLNVYAGPAGFYLVRGGPFDLPGDELPRGLFEIPVAIQDRSFNAGNDGTTPLFYPNSRRCFDDATEVPPIWNPEFFGNTIVERPHLAGAARRADGNASGSSTAATLGSSS